VLRVQLFGVADHAEQTDALGYAVNREVGVEDLVAAVLAVGLRKHHQLDIGRVAFELWVQGIGAYKVVDFVSGQCQAKLGVGLLQRRLAAVQHVDGLQRRALEFGKQPCRLVALEHHALGHAVMEQRGDVLALVFSQSSFAKKPGLHNHAVFGDALDAFDSEAAVVRDVGRL